MTISVIIASTNTFFIDGIRSILEGKISVAGQCTEQSETALNNCVEESNPDVIILDIESCTEGCLNLIQLVSGEKSSPKVIGIADELSADEVRNLARRGINGLIHKNKLSQTLVNGVHEVVEGVHYFSPTYGDFRDSDIDAGELGQPLYDFVLRTKLTPPQIYAEQVIRTEQIDKLELGIAKPMSLVSAPAGYGKSETVAQWIKNTTAINCWISLDDEHNDLRVFLNYLVAGLDRMIENIVPQTAVMAAAGDMPPVRAIAYSLINELDLIEENFVIVLDDFHLITNRKVHELIDEILTYPPQQQHLCIITRRDPPLKLHGLLAKGRLHEIRMKDLAFTEKEIVQLFENLLKVKLDKDTAHTLKQKTEGWIVALRMASFLVQDANKKNEILSEFRGDIYSLSKYMLEEILMKQPAEFQELLMKASLLDRFCAELIDKISHGSGPQGEEFIRWLTETNLFIISLDYQQEWYRFHHLIQDFLHGFFKNNANSAKLVKTHMLASQWLEQNGYIEEAINQAVKAKQYDEAGRIIERHRSEELDNDRWYVVHRWLQKLPKEQLNGPPMLLSAAWASYENFQFAQMFEYLELAKAALNDSKEHVILWGEWNLLMGLLTFWSGDAPHALEHFDSANEQLEDKEDLATGMLKLHMGMARGVTGKFDLAIHELEGQMSESKGQPVYMTRLHAGLFYNSMFAGKLANAKSGIQGVVSISKKSGIIYTQSMAYCMEATAWFCGNQLEEALALYEQLQQNRYIIHKGTAIDALAASVISYELLGRPDEADATLKRLIGFVEELNDPAYQLLADSCVARLAVLRGDIEQAMIWQERITTDVIFAGLFIWIEVPQLTKARVLIKEGSASSLKKAGELLSKIEETAISFNLVNHQIEVATLQLVLAVKLNDKKLIGDSLEKALALAEPGNWLRPFVEWSDELLPVLDRFNSGLESSNFLLRVVEGMKERSTPHIKKIKQEIKSTTSEQGELLSVRELEVVRLIDQGFRNQEIADEIFVSVGTVKKHIYRIGKKWNLHSRITIVQRAKELDYI